MRRLAPLLFVLAACGGEPTGGGPAPTSCARETRADTYALGLAKTGAGGTVLVRLTDALPAPPDRGDNAWTLEVLDASSMQPVRTATITARPWMPDHGHGTTPLLHSAKPAGAGRFTLGPMNFFMPGYWTITISVEADGRAKDDAVFAFCLEG